MNHLFLARIILEAKTPLAVGTGEKDILTDKLIAHDVNHLPYIPGTSLVGVLRNNLADVLDENAIKSIFGYQSKAEEDSEGSRLIASSAYMIGTDGNIIDSLQNIDFDNPFYGRFLDLPLRQHVRISESGACDKKMRGKFDNQIVYTGTRFGFEIELISDGSEFDKSLWNEIINHIHNENFRLGGGTRKGYGKVEVVELKQAELNMKKDLNTYLNKTSNLNDTFWNSVKNESWIGSSDSKMDCYRIELTPDDFFLFSSGLESKDADITYISEPIITWHSNKPGFTDKKILIPATSVKGAISHRLAYHYNKLSGVFSDKSDTIPMTAENTAVKKLFGFSANNEDGQRGNVIMSDLYLNEQASVKLLNHVSIDRFTGGAIAGALFNEEVIYGDQKSFALDIYVEKKALPDINVKEAFSATLLDICNGLLPLGGGTMRGHGSFTGKLFINGKEA